MQILNEQYNKVHTWNDEFMNILKWCVHFSSLIWCYVVRGRGLFKHVCVSLIGWFIFCFYTRSRWVYIQCNAVQDVKLCNFIRTVFIKGFYYLLFWIYPRVVQTYCENVQWMCSNATKPPAGPVYASSWNISYMKFDVSLHTFPNLPDEMERAFY